MKMKVGAHAHKLHLFILTHSCRQSPRRNLGHLPDLQAIARGLQVDGIVAARLAGQQVPTALATAADRNVVAPGHLDKRPLLPPRIVVLQRQEQFDGGKGLET